MKSVIIACIAVLMAIPMMSCKQRRAASDANIIFLHHSTGLVIWNGKSNSRIGRFVRSKSSTIAGLIGVRAQLPSLFKQYNKDNHTRYSIKIFPDSPYPWANFPYDYYYLWVKNAGEEPAMGQPTLEILTREYNVIIFKHCFPVSNIQEDNDSADINSDEKTIANYKLQYMALRDKLHAYPDTKFILFTGAALVKASVTEDEARRAREFFNWVKEEWDLGDDNIFLWDLYELETEGGLYFKNEYTASTNDSHPNEDFAGRVVELLFNRIVDVIEKDGTGTNLTGDYK